MAHLEVKTPQGLKRVKLGGGATTIGRQPDNAVVLTDDMTSRHHCVIEPWRGGFRVRDLGSSNGTRLNDQKVTTEALDNGDVLKVGRTILRFIAPEQAAAQPRHDVPDFSAALDDKEANLHDRDTLDVDLHTAVTDAPTSYERKLREIIDASPERLFEDTDLSLVDCRGVTVHQATSSGLESGSAEEETGEGLRVFRLLLLACFRARATDLHVEPGPGVTTVRMRVDGYMISAVELSMAIYLRLLGMVKILCQVDTSRKNVVQDGHFSVAVKGRRVDYRVSLTPAMHGQKLVVRVLDSANAPSRLHELGLVPWMYEKIRAIATRDAGLLLACGQTGCGKTTSLYSCIREIDVSQRNAITIEDPVEYYLEGCTQIPIDHKQEATFANILRSV
ncbi:MAG: ATPase, T2SS/T4P/T4SS family, partial [Planctomycetota bacterium]